MCIRDSPETESDWEGCLSVPGLRGQGHVSARLGGVGPGPWGSLNFGVLRGDDRQRVAANRRLLAVWPSSSAAQPNVGSA